jgi:hypothetical protein
MPNRAPVEKVWACAVKEPGVDALKNVGKVSKKDLRDVIARKLERRRQQGLEHAGKTLLLTF